MATILLTGAGGAAIPSLIRHLKGLGHRVLACDMNPQAPGLFLADKGFVVPPAHSPDFDVVVSGVCKQEAVDVIIPLVDEELLPVRCYLSQHQINLSPSGIFTDVCLDKWQLMCQLHGTGVTVPNTIRGVEMNSFHGTRPLIIKPRCGRGSRGVVVCKSPSDVQNWMQVHHTDAWDFIVQEYIDGPEYTVSAVCDQHNTVHAVVPKEIIRKEGSTWLAVTRRNEKIDALCRRIADVMHPCGPFNVQLRLRNDEPYVFEINPRFSGTVNLTIAAGCDEVGGLIELALGNPYTFGQWREGVVLVRHTEDSIMEETEFGWREPVRWDG